MTRLVEPRSPAWVGLLMVAVLTMAGVGLYLTIAKAIDLALVTWAAQ